MATHYYFLHVSREFPPIKFHISDLVRDSREEHVIAINLILAIRLQEELIAERRASIGQGYW